MSDSLDFTGMAWYRDMVYQGPEDAPMRNQVWKAMLDE